MRPRIEGTQERTVHPLPAAPLRLAVHASHERNGVGALYERPVVAGEELGAETGQELVRQLAGVQQRRLHSLIWRHRAHVGL